MASLYAVLAAWLTTVSLLFQEESQNQELKDCRRFFVRSVLPIQSKIRHLSSNHVLLPVRHCQPTPSRSPSLLTRSAARQSYSMVCLHPFRMLCFALWGCSPDWILDELIISCWKRYAHFVCPGLGWQWPNETALEAHPLAPRWRREQSVTGRRQHKQRAVCRAPPAIPPSSRPSKLSLSLGTSEKTELPRKWKGAKQKRKVCLAPEIILAHLFCWC